MKQVYQSTILHRLVIIFFYKRSILFIEKGLIDTYKRKLLLRIFSIFLKEIIDFVFMW